MLFDSTCLKKTDKLISPRFIDETPRTPAFGLHMSFATLEQPAAPILNPSHRASSLEVEDAVHFWGLLHPGLRVASDGSEPRGEIKDELLLEVEDAEDHDAAHQPSPQESHLQNFSIAIVGVTAVAGIERVIDLPVLHAMASRMFSPPKASGVLPSEQHGASDFKNSVQFNLHMPSIPRPVSGRLFKNGKITLSSVKTFGVKEVFDAIINEVKQAHLRAKEQGPNGVDVISGWTDDSPISLVGGNVRLSLQLQFQLPFPVNYKKMIRHLKCGSQFLDPIHGSILIRFENTTASLAFILFLIDDISDVRPNLPCGAGFMFATEFPQYVFTTPLATDLSDACAGMAASRLLCSTVGKFKLVVAVMPMW